MFDWNIVDRWRQVTYKDRVNLINRWTGRKESLPGAQTSQDSSKGRHREPHNKGAMCVSHFHSLILC